MGSTKSKRKNKNQFKKVYPYIRRRPVYTYELDKEAIIETAKVEFIDSSQETYEFTSLFPGVPTINGTAVDEAGNNVNVNVFIEAVTTTTVTIGVSESFTGFVNLHALYVAE